VERWADRETDQGGSLNRENLMELRSSMFVLILVALIPATGVVVVVWRAHKKRFWLELCIYFAGAFLGGCLFAVLSDAAFPFVSSVYAGWLDIQTNLLRRLFGRAVSNVGIWVAGFAVALAPLYLGAATGTWLVWRRRRKIFPKE
jgi:hypothetical protein